MFRGLSKILRYLLILSFLSYVLVAQNDYPTTTTTMSLKQTPLVYYTFKFIGILSFAAYTIGKLCRAFICTFSMALALDYLEWCFPATREVIITHNLADFSVQSHQSDTETTKFIKLSYSILICCIPLTFAYTVSGIIALSVSYQLGTCYQIGIDYLINTVGRILTGIVAMFPLIIGGLFVIANGIGIVEFYKANKWIGHNLFYILLITWNFLFLI